MADLRHPCQTTTPAHTQIRLPTQAYKYLRFPLKFRNKKIPTNFFSFFCSFFPPSPPSLSLRVSPLTPTTFHGVHLTTMRAKEKIAPSESLQT